MGDMARALARLLDAHGDMVSADDRLAAAHAYLADCDEEDPAARPWRGREARERLPRTEEKAAKATARFQRERAAFVAELEALAQVAGLLRRDVAGIGFVDVRAMYVALDELAAARAAR